MTTFLMMMTLSLSMMMTMISHPMSLGFTIILQIVLISMLTGTMIKNFWFSYILFLIMIGGMLVLFIYMTSIASNEKFSFSKSAMITMIIMMTASTLMFMNMDNFLMYSNKEIVYNTNMDKEMIMNKMMNFPSSVLMIILIIYLFITLIAVVKISKSKYGPLRQMN